MREIEAKRQGKSLRRLGGKRKWLKLRMGNAGLIASFAVALAGALFGALAAYIGPFGGVADASRTSPPGVDGPSLPMLRAAAARDKRVQQVIDTIALERLPAPSRGWTGTAERPRIAIVIDDLGIDDRATERAMAMPGPVSYAFLPYAKNLTRHIEAAKARDGDILLHLPMEPKGPADPGPNALRADMSGAEFLRALEWNLSQFDGYAGVNNHMGSRLTAHRASMKTVLAYLKDRDLFFVDSVTTSDTVARSEGARIGADVLTRDVFLDSTPGDADEVRRQLRVAERIAQETGFVIVIGHPRPETLEVLGPWLATAQARGFELTTPSRLLAPDKPALAVAAPALRG